MSFEECPEGGGQGEDGMERRQVVAKQQDQGHDEVVERHPQGYLLSTENPVQSFCDFFHQAMVGLCKY